MTLPELADANLPLHTLAAQYGTADASARWPEPWPWQDLDRGLRDEGDFPAW